VLHWSILHERQHELNSTMRDISVELEILYIELVSVSLSLGLVVFQVFKILIKLQLASRFVDSVVCSYKSIRFTACQLF
jgi:hypothetical protein